MRVCFATSRDAAFAEDDGALDVAATAAGLRAERQAWDDPAVDWSAFNLVLIRTTWNYTARLAEFRDWMVAVSRVTRLENPLAVSSWSCDKRYLRELEAEGVPVIPTSWSDQEDLAGAIAAMPEGSRGFLKPVVGATSEGTLRFVADESGRAAATRHVAAHQVPMMLQPYLSAVERLGEVSVVVLDGVASHAVRKLPVAGDYRVQEDFGAVDQSLPLEDAPVAAALSAIAAASRRCGAAPLVGRVDFLFDERGTPRINELELVEPCLFFRHGPGAADRLVRAVMARAGA